MAALVVDARVLVGIFNPWFPLIPKCRFTVLNKDSHGFLVNSSGFPALGFRGFHILGFRGFHSWVSVGFIP